MKKLTRFNVLLFIIFLSASTGQWCFAQNNIGINSTGNPPDPSAMLDVDAADKGFLLPRITESARDAIGSPAPSLMIYNTTSNCLEIYMGGVWQHVMCPCAGPPDAPGAITGTTSVSGNATGVTYSIAAVAGASSYTWTVPSGASIVSGDGTTNISVDFGTSPGDVCVTANNACGSSSASCQAISITANQSITFDRNSAQYAAIADNAQTGLDITGDLTIEAWFKLNTLPGNGEYYGIVSKSDLNISPYPPVTHYAYALWYDYDSGRRFSFNINGADPAAAGRQLMYNFTFNANQWYHVAAVYTAGTQMEIFIDGVSVASTTSGVPASIIDSPDDFKIGTASPTGTNTLFDGLIDDVRIWNVARTSTEINADYQQELSGSEPNLQGYWRLNNDYTDSSPNGNNLTPVNSPAFSNDVPF